MCLDRMWGKGRTKELASPLRTVRLPGGQPDDKGQVEAVMPFRKKVRLDAVIVRLSTGVPGALALTSKGTPAVPAVRFCAAARLCAAARFCAPVRFCAAARFCAPVRFCAAANAARKESSNNLITGIVAVF
jgi:hypothetical protein